MTEIITLDHHRIPPRRRGARLSHDEKVAAADLRLTRALARARSADTPPINELGYAAALGSMALATKLAIAADFECFAYWAAANRYNALPAEPETIVRYLQHLDEAGLTPATLERRLASIARAHQLAGVADEKTIPTRAAMVRDQLRSIRRARGTRQKQAAPVRYGVALDPETHGFTLEALLAACTPDLRGLRDAALLSVGYDAGLRVSELTAVEWVHIKIHRDKTGTLLIPFSKTDQEGKGDYAWLSTDTIQRVRRWIAESGRVAAQGPLFRRIAVERTKARPGLTRVPARTRFTIGSDPLTRQGVNKIYRRVATAALDRGLVDIPLAEQYGAIQALSTHSLRIGLSQDLVASGADMGGICNALRWKTPDMALRYARELQTRSKATAQLLRKVRSGQVETIEADLRVPESSADE